MIDYISNNFPFILALSSSVVFPLIGAYSSGKVNGAMINKEIETIKKNEEKCKADRKAEEKSMHEKIDKNSGKIRFIEGRLGIRGE